MTGPEATLLGFGGFAVVNLIAVGVGWGNLRTGQNTLKKDMDEVKGALGLTGKDEGVFVRRGEMNLRVDEAEKEHDRIHRRITHIEERL